MQVSIIIVNYNTKHLTYNCIQSIYHFTSDIDVEIIVVDNDSSDQSIEFLESSFPNVMYIRSSTNIGFGLANNLGVRSAKGEFIFLLNSDTLLKENSIKKMHDFFVKNEKSMNLGVVGCKLLDIDLQMNSIGDDFPTCKTEITKMILSVIPMKYKIKLIEKFFHHWDSNLNKQYNAEQESFEIDYVIGADMFLRKDVFERFEGFSKDYFMYYEEVDLQKKMAHSGLSHRIYTGTEIIHYEGGSKLPSAFKRMVSHKSRYHYLKNHDFKRFFYFRIVQHAYFLCIFLNSNYSLKDNITYSKEMLSFIYQSKKAEISKMFHS
jgi:GT2 family glycosyltransferase